MKYGAYLTGAFGQSQELYKARNAVKRGRALPKVISEQILNDTRLVIDKQIDAGLDFVIDPMLRFFDLFQPLTEGFPPLIERVEGTLPSIKVRGFSAGPQENYFDNNIFYLRPLIDETIDINATGFTKPYVHSDMLPSDRKAVVLPSPFAFAMLSNFAGKNGYELPFDDRVMVVSNLARLIAGEAQHLAHQGFKRIQYDEPVVVHRQYLRNQFNPERYQEITKEDIALLKLAMRYCGSIDSATTILHTYFGDAGPILQQLLELKIDGIGIDATRTSLEDVLRHDFSGKELAIGLVDARSTAPENPEELARYMEHLASTRANAIWIVPNTGTEYRGWSNGLRKIEVLIQTMEILKNA